MKWVSGFFLLFLCLQLCLAVEFAQLLSLRIQPSPTKTTFIFILNKKASGTVKSLTNPERVILEFVATDKRFNIQNARLGGSNVESISTKTFTNGNLQFIFITKNKVRWNTQFLVSPDKNRVIFQLEIISVENPSLLPDSRFREEGSPEFDDSQLHANNKFVVAIDAGHGGKDPGARGLTGIYEKDIVLAIAKKLAIKINKTPNQKAILTRSGDYYVPLRNRLKLARKDKADIFVAIHADAYFNHKATGISVYALSQRGATSEAARWLAQKDNYSELGDIKLDTLPDRSPMVQSVLIDLAQTATIRDSILLGNKLLDALDDISSLHYTQVEQAPFLVLKSPDIPSVLVETGFLSNPIEERLLAEDAYQEELAHALYQGIQKYVKKYGS